jgi:phasin family protein
MLTPQQLIELHQQNVKALFGLTEKAFEGVEKMLELNIQATKASLAESVSHTQEVLEVTSPQQLLVLQNSIFKPLAEKAVHFNGLIFALAQISSKAWQKPPGQPLEPR